MFDWLRGLTKSAEIRRQERTIAYVDGTLSQQERVAFEAEMARDAALKQDVDELRQIKSTLNSLPRQRVPHNFTLDPAVYGKPEPAYDVQLYPVLRAATAVCALVFIVMATLTLFPSGSLDSLTMGAAEESAADVAFDDLAAAPIAAQPTEDPANSQLYIESDDSADTIAPQEVTNDAMLEEAEIAADSADSADMMMAEPVAEESMADEAMEDASVDAAADSAEIDDSAMMEEAAAEAEPDTSTNNSVVTQSESVASDAEMAEDEGLAAEPEPMPSPSFALEIAPPTDADDAAAGSEFRTTPLDATPSPPPTIALEQFSPTQNRQFSQTLETEIAASDTAPESKNSVGTENIAVETVESREQSNRAPTNPLVYWMIAFAVLSILLLAATLWVRSRL